MLDFSFRNKSPSDCKTNGKLIDGNASFEDKTWFVFIIIIKKN